MNWFECKVSYDKLLEDGISKKVTEPYLVDALSFTEAEARILEEVKPYISGEFSVAGIRKLNVHEFFFNENGDRYYRAKVLFISLDEKKGKEIRKPHQFWVQASTVKEAINIIEERMKGSLADYAIASVTETMILDVFPYSADKVDLKPEISIPAEN